MSRSHVEQMVAALPQRPTFEIHHARTIWRLGRRLWTGTLVKMWRTYYIVHKITLLVVQLETRVVMEA